MAPDILASLPCLVFIKDQAGRYLHVNQALADFVGLSPSDLIGKSHHELGLPESMAEEWARSDQDALTSEAGFIECLEAIPDRHGHIRWIQTRKVRWCPDGREQPLVLGLGLEITQRFEEHESRKRELALGELLLAVASRLFDTRADSREPVLDAMQQIGEFVNADRAYVFNYLLDEGICRNTHEWCAEGIAPHIQDLQALPLTELQAQFEQHQQDEPWLVSDVRSLDNEWIRDMLSSQGIQSLVTVPMVDGEDCVGFVGFDSVRSRRNFSVAECRLLQLFARLLLNYWRQNRQMTELRQARDRLTLWSKVFEHSHEGIMITNRDNRIVEVNDAFSRITGFDRAEVIGRSPRVLSAGSTNPEIYQDLWRKLDTAGVWSGELWNRRKNGEVWAESITISAARNEIGEISHYIGLFSDVTEQKKYQQRLEKLAHHDSLTNLPNRARMTEALEQATAEARREGGRLAIAYIDLDGFKAINDQYGHDVGDQFICHIGERLQGALRNDDIVARIGGDEFVTLIKDMDDEHAIERVLSRLLHALSTPMEISGERLQCSGSIGVTFFPQDEDLQAEQLLRQADQAMYVAKHQGKNQIAFFDTQSDRYQRSQIEQRQRIREALTQEEFRLFYQPKVNLVTGALVGVEALIRWEHPEHGLLPPDLFLPLVENDSSLTVAVGNWVITQALRDLSRLKAAGLNISVSVNISAGHLLHADFQPALARLIESHGSIQRGELILEVVESSLIEDLSRAQRVMRDCLDLGVLFSLDDFGTGYSSLAYLKNLPLAELKIDRTFVRDLRTDPDDLTIIQGIIGLSRAFGIEIIAEGVESDDHGTMLLYLGCQFAQGFGIGKPMPLPNLLSWAKDWKPSTSWCSTSAIDASAVDCLRAEAGFRAWSEQILSHSSVNAMTDMAVNPEPGGPQLLQQLLCAGESPLTQDLTLQELFAEALELGTRLHQSHDNKETQSRFKQLCERVTTRLRTHLQ